MPVTSGTLDVSAAALDRARAGLGESAARFAWIVADVTAIGDIGRFEIGMTARFSTF